MVTPGPVGSEALNTPSRSEPRAAPHERAAVPEQPTSSQVGPAQRLADDGQRTSAASRLLPGVGQTPALNRLAALAARLLASPSAQVSLLTTTQTIAAGSGLPEGAVGSQGSMEDSLCTVTAALGGPLVVSDAQADERVTRLPPVTSGAVGAYLGVPLTTTDGAQVGALCVFDRAPHAWSAYEVALLEELAGAVMAELELSALSAEYEASRLRWDVAIDAAGIGSFDWDLRTDRVDWDERMQALFGYAPGEFVPHLSEALSRIDPEDRADVDAAIEAAVESCGDYRAEFRVVLPGGGQRWVAARGRAMAGDDGRAGQLIGSAYDITEVRTARDEAVRLLETMATGFLSVDRDWRVTYLNGTAERVVGMGPDELVGRVLWEAFPGLEGIEFGRRYKHAMSTGETVEVEAYYGHLDGWFEVTAVPGPDGLALYFLEITARRAAQELALAATARLELLAAVSAELAAAALETKQAVARLAQLVVPALADWCIVSLAQNDETLQDVGCWHVRPELRPVVERYSNTRFEDLEQRGAVSQAGDAGDPVIIRRDMTELALSRLTSAEARAAIRQLAPESSVVLPLIARGHVPGVLTLCRGADRPPMSNEEIATAREVAARAGLALDNARLYAQQRNLAEGLQRSLLTDPPEPDHCQIAVRYQPAEEIASVGGDWFDSFLTADGATTLVIGDVVGHDTEAAAAMGQIRGLLRGIAWDSGAAPASVLTRLDAAMEGLQVATTASAVIARLEQTPGEREQGVTRLRWSNAGHPPPMAVNPDGSVVVLAGMAPDLLLGIEPGTHRTESQISLDRGATVVLYTDGLIERRGENLDTGLARLRDTLAEVADRPLDELCDELLRRMVSAADDDIALIAVRLHRQHQPRPAEAGPTRVPPKVPTEPET